MANPTMRKKTNTMTDRIDYRAISLALDYYEGKGYRYIEVPWLVSRDACFATIPTDFTSGAMSVGSRYLVGSGEQGFLDLKLAPGRYVTCSPCFRAGDNCLPYHQETFMKVELFQNNDVSDIALIVMMNHVVELFKHLSGKTPAIAPTDDGWDIELAGVELGSYGRRTALGQTWLYGTGLALPRFTQVASV